MAANPKNVFFFCGLSVGRKKKKDRSPQMAAAPENVFPHRQLRALWGGERKKTDLTCLFSFFFLQSSEPENVLPHRELRAGKIAYIIKTKVET